MEQMLPLTRNTSDRDLSNNNEIVIKSMFQQANDQHQPKGPHITRPTKVASIIREVIFFVQQRVINTETHGRLKWNSQP